MSVISWVELNNPKVKTVGSLFKQSDVVTIGERHGKTPAQVLLRWATQRGIAVIPKSNQSERLAENLACCDFDLTDAEIEVSYWFRGIPGSVIDVHYQKITSLDAEVRFNDPGEVSPKMAIFA